jgi:hypothetical protein
MSRSVSWDQPTHRSLIHDKGTTHKQRRSNQKGHSKSVLALQRLRMRSVLYCGT